MIAFLVACGIALERLVTVHNARLFCYQLLPKGATLILPSRSLTAAAIDRISPPKQGQAEVFDKGYPGLALRLSYGGAKAWVFYFRLHRKLRRITLGRHPSMSLAEAREAWRKARAMAAKGVNPAQPAGAADSVEAVLDEWLKRDQAKNRSALHVKRFIERDVLPLWRDRLVTSISRRDVMGLIDSIVDRGTVSYARRLHAHLHRAFRWSVGRGIIETNPMADLPKPGAPVARDRVLTDAELAMVWKAAGDLGWPYDSVFRLLILTGARRSEIGGLRWCEIDGDVIRLEGARTKTGESHTIPLSPEAAAIIKALPRIAGSEYVFTTVGTKPLGGGWGKAKRRCDEQAARVPAWRLHDLRRTVATGLQRLGIGLQAIEAVLGHVSGSRAGIVGVYQRHTFDGEKRAALEAWARHVGAIVSGKPAKVISMRSGG